MDKELLSGKIKKTKMFFLLFLLDFEFPALEVPLS